MESAAGARLRDNMQREIDDGGADCVLLADWRANGMDDAATSFPAFFIRALPLPVADVRLRIAAAHCVCSTGKTITLDVESSDSIEAVKQVRRHSRLCCPRIAASTVAFACMLTAGDCLSFVSLFFGP
jgi:hypothetical protein